MGQTNQDKILASLERYGPQCDDCLSESTLVRPRQQVHQICSYISRAGLIERIRNRVCPRCHRRKITNEINRSGDDLPRKPQSIFDRAASEGLNDLSERSRNNKNHDVEALSEDEIKQCLEAELRRQGWETEVAWGNQQGIDIDARRGQERWIIEVKGPGSRPPMRVNYFLAILGELLQRMDDPEARYSLALPDLPQFRRLWERLPALAKERTGIGAIFVSKDGAIEFLDR